MPPAARSRLVVSVASVASAVLVMALPAPRPARAADAAAPVERRLHLASAEASSFLVNDWNRFQENYLPLYVGDDDPKTAWSEGVKGDGVGEWLRVKVTAMTGVTRVRLRVRNGYQKSARLFAANGRARGVTVVLLPSGKTVDAELEDRQDWQEIVAAQPAGPLSAVEIRVRSAFPGKTYDDLCISDVQLMVTATTPDNPAFEKSRFDQLLKWKAERLAAARLFKTAMGKKLPFSPQYTASWHDDGEDEDLDHIPGARAESAVKAVRCPKETSSACPIRQEIARAGADAAVMKTHAAALGRARVVMDRLASLPAVKAVASDRRRIPTVDGLCVPTIHGCDGDPCGQALPLPGPGLVAFMNAAQIATLDVKDSPSVDEIAALKPRECGLADVVKTWSWAQRGPAAAGGAPGPIEALFLATCGAVPSREGYVSQSTEQLLVYGTDGNLELIVGQDYAAMLKWRAGAQGPVLAGGRVVGSGHEMDVEEVVKIAAAAIAAPAAAPSPR